MIKQKKILLNYLLKQYQQSLKEFSKFDDDIAIDLKRLKYVFNNYGMNKIQKIINQYGNLWNIKEIMFVNSKNFKIDNTMLNNIPIKGKWFSLVNVKNKNIIESIPQECCRKVLTIKIPQY